MSDANNTQNNSEKKSNDKVEVPIVEPDNICTKHKNILKYCSECSKDICRKCILKDKEELIHYKTHFKSIKDKEATNSVISQLSDKENTESQAEQDNKIEEPFTLHDYEGFELLNKHLLEQLSKTNYKTERIINNILYNKQKIVFHTQEKLTELYLELTDSFEKTVKAVNANISNLNINDNNAKEEFNKLKKDLDSLTEFLDSEEKLKQLFESILVSAEKNFTFTKLSEICHENYGVLLSKHGKFTGLKISTPENLNIFKFVKTNYGTQVISTSLENIQNNFEFKIRIIKINEKKAKSYSNYCIGIIRNNAISPDTYFNNSILLQSNGFLYNKFSNISYGSKLFSECWKDGDIISCLKDEKNDIYFKLNDEPYKKAYNEVTGNFNVVIGVNNSVEFGEFELLELIESSEIIKQ